MIYPSIKSVLIVPVFLCCTGFSYQALQNNELAVTPKGDTELSYDTYCNGRFEFCVDYPKGLLFPQRESDNGDGRRFKNKQGEEILLVFGTNNFDLIPIVHQYQEDLDKAYSDGVVTYHKLAKSYFVISGYKKGKIFYQKTIIKDDSFAYAILEYDEREKATYDKVSERIFNSFE